MIDHNTPLSFLTVGQLLDVLADRENNKKKLVENTKSKSEILNKGRLTPSEVSEITGLSLQTVYQYHSNGKLPGGLRFRSRLLFDTKTIIGWIEDNIKEPKKIHDQIEIDELDKERFLIKYFRLSDPVKNTIRNSDINLIHLDKFLSLSILDIDLSVRAIKCLKSVGIETVYDVVTHSKNDLLKIRNLGKKTQNEIYNMLKSHSRSYEFLFSE